jgi:3-oxoacyl-[acyl-carrier-protein] synthase III
MAFSVIPDVTLKGISACVPKTVLENRNLPVFSGDEVKKFIASTGVERKRIAGNDICTSDLCFHAAEQLISDLNWDKSGIDCLIFVTQTPDYDLPATSCILQHRLGLNNEVIAIDISSGCSGWVYGLNVIASLLSAGNHKRGLLLVGETSLKFCSTEDKSTYPLFGDAGTATALEFTKGGEGLKFHLATDGSRFETIIIPDGGYRNMITSDSFSSFEAGQDIKRNPTKLFLDGMNVFSFGILRAPESVNLLLSHFDLDKNRIDLFVFHQANLFLNEMIRKKLNLDTEKVPYSLRDFGNTSSASIPLTIALNCQKLAHSPARIVACGFGVGLSWGSVFFETDNLVCSGLVEI